MDPPTGLRIYRWAEDNFFLIWKLLVECIQGVTDGVIC